MALTGVLAVLLLLTFRPYPAFGATAEQSYNEGMRYFQETHQWYEAIHSFKDAVEADPNYWQAHEALAKAYEKVGNKAKAIEAAETSLTLHPDNSELQKLFSEWRLDTPDINAPKPPVPSARRSPYQIEVMGGIAFNNRNPGAGLSCGVRGIYLMGPRWGIGGSLDFQSIFNSSQTVIDDGSSGTGRIDLNTSNTYYAFDLLATVEYSLTENTDLAPYAVGGLGFSRPGSSGSTTIDSKNPSYPSSTTNFSGGGDIFGMAQAGLGVAYTSPDDMKFFLECKANMILTANIYVFFPINVGIQFTP